jgi:hypothetical protein
MVVVVHTSPDDVGRPDEVEVGSNEDSLRARADEDVDERLSEAEVDLARGLRGPLEPVPPRVVDVDVEPVLVRDVPGAAETRAEVPTMREAEVADAHAGRVRVASRVRIDCVQRESHEIVRSEAAPPAARRSVPERIPGEEEAAARRKLHPPD